MLLLSIIFLSSCIKSDKKDIPDSDVKTKSKNGIEQFSLDPSAVPGIVQASKSLNGESISPTPIKIELKENSNNKNISDCKIIRNNKNSVDVPVSSLNFYSYLNKDGNLFKIDCGSDKSKSHSFSGSLKFIVKGVEYDKNFS